MPRAFGLLLPIGPKPGQPNSFLADLDWLAPRVSGQINHFWMTDHFMWQDRPMFECWTVLATLAARYPEFQVGPMVLSQSYRNPALLAKMGKSLHHLSGGRMILALGAGWAAEEYIGYGYPFPPAGVRIQQLEEALIIIKRLWYDPGPVSFHGQYYQIQNAYCEPRPSPPPPIMVGGSGNKLLRVVAQHADAWNYTDPSYENFKARLAVLHQHCAEIGRDPTSIQLTWMPHLALGRTQAAAQAHAPDFDPAVHLIGTPAQIAKRIEPFLALGVTTIMFELHGMFDAQVVNLLVEDLLPRLRALANN